MEAPKKSTSDRGKEVCNDATERNSLQNNKTSTQLPKITQNVDKKSGIALKKAEQEQSVNVYLDRNEGKSKGESSKPFALPLHLSGSSSRRPIMCKFCGQTFSSTQALGGHQNAHKQERELQKALKAARDFRNNPFMYDYNLARETFPKFPGSNFGRHHFGYHPYPGYAQRAFQGFQAKPVYSHPVIGLPQGPPGLGQALDRFKPVSTTFNPGWPTPYDYSPRMGPIRRINAPTNFNAVGEHNMTALMQAMGNDASIPQRQCMEPSSIHLSPRCNIEPSKTDSQNESAELDLDLKL